ncbi:MAG: hypothetical protein LUQ37_10150, partial [Methanoregulaceae archaeon]|nr:hypothetical protein [Methanoregulaceae archaeon]
SYLAQCIQASVLKLWMREDSAQLTRVNLGDLWVFAQRFPQYEYWYRDDSGSHMLPMAWE